MGHSEAIWSLKVYKLLKFCLEKLLSNLLKEKPPKIPLIFPPTNENFQNYRLLFGVRKKLHACGHSVKCKLTLNEIYFIK